jgi:hypothetical protein
MLIVPLGAWTDHRAEDSIGTTTAANKAGLVSSDPGVQSNVEGRPEEMYERFWHAMVRIRIEGIREVSRRWDNGGCIGRDEF